ncbi:hypothetical protein PHMEG_00015331 [Phytophthora megakarya]|uniref:Uncharacterized protein n=1 Tax=Phytophthora megakarya TaxID=4795 RepID=A0A225W437_9STRA|nr:hypothetical protein PHMEG_00015331 [Phytophthora megakarya]
MLTVIPVTQLATLGIAFVKVIFSAGARKRTSSTRQDVINRTNNPRKRFNRELNAAFPTSHPNLRTYIAPIERISSVRVVTLSPVMSGLPNIRRPSFQPLAGLAYPLQFNTLHFIPDSTTKIYKLTLER